MIKRYKQRILYIIVLPTFFVPTESSLFFSRALLLNYFDGLIGRQIRFLLFLIAEWRL